MAENVAVAAGPRVRPPWTYRCVTSSIKLNVGKNWNLLIWRTNKDDKVGSERGVTRIIIELLFIFYYYKLESSYLFSTLEVV